MPDPSQHSLVHIIKSSGLYLFGQSAGYVLQLICGILVVRYLTTAEYGLFSLSMTLINISVVVSCVGFENGLPRVLSKTFSTRGGAGPGNVITTSALIVLFTSLFLCLGLYSVSGYLAHVFDKPSLAGTIQTLCLLIPASAMISIMVSIFRGLEITHTKVLFQDFLLTSAKLSAYLFVIYYGLAYPGVLQANVAVYYFTFVLFLTYTILKLRQYISRPVKLDMAPELIQFSMPLMGTNILNMLAIWATPLMLGFFMASEYVGLYGASMTLANFLSIPLASMVFLYLPVATRLFSSNQHEKLMNLYNSVTKWSFLLVLPFAFMILFDTEFILRFLFGDKYAPAEGTLRIISAGFLFHAMLGPNGMTLLACGRSDVLLSAAFIGAAVNMILCVLLIPVMGVTGAALGVSISIAVLNLVLTISLYRWEKIHVLTPHYLKPVLLFFTVTGFMGLTFELADPTAYGQRLLLYLFLMSLAVFSPFLTRSIDQEDRDLFESFRNRLFQK